MSDDPCAGEFYRNIWAPWRMEYIESLGGEVKGCFLCDHRDQADRDAENFVLFRGRDSYALLNRFPYTGGHALIAPYAHVANLDGLDAPSLVEIMRFARDLQAIMAKALRAQGFNIGINIGRCAGAGLPGHLHLHVVPRWNGDTNFMPLLGGARVIPVALSRLREELLAAAEEMKLPKLDE